ncbi:MAG: ACT domain-containing protein [Oscillospiraceae bacterium]|nr:ACT domain-containing protein [Oscillospiraceae bacterium]
MKLEKVKCNFSVCKLSNLEQIDLSRPYVFLSITLDEISLVCASECVPANAIEVECGWKALRVAGVLDFSLIGIVAKISGILAEVDISIFVVSTYDTDYILLKSENFDRAIAALSVSGYDVD